MYDKLWNTLPAEEKASVLNYFLEDAWEGDAVHIHFPGMLLHWKTSKGYFEEVCQGSSIEGFLGSSA